MKNVSKLLLVVAFCGVTLTALLSFTTAKSEATRAFTVTPLAFDGVIRPDVSVPVADPALPQNIEVERLVDGCSGDVVIKVPWTGPDAPSLDSNDIVLARSQAMCGLVEGSPPTHKGVCQHNPDQFSAWTETIPYSSIRNSERRFRWFCRKQAERSRCASGTTRVRFRLKPHDDFETQCLR